MSLLAPLQHELDLDRHAGEHIPDMPVPKPQIGLSLEMDPEVAEGTAWRAFSYTESLLRNR